MRTVTLTYPDQRRFTLSILEPITADCSLLDIVAAWITQAHTDWAEARIHLQERTPDTGWWVHTTTPESDPDPTHFIGVLTVERGRLIDTNTAAEICRRDPSTIRQWIARNKLTAWGKDHAGRHLVNLTEAIHLATKGTPA